MDLDKLGPVLLVFDSGRAAQKAKFGGEFFPAGWPADERIRICQAPLISFRPTRIQALRKALWPWIQEVFNDKRMRGNTASPGLKQNDFRRPCVAFGLTLTIGTNSILACANCRRRLLEANFGDLEAELREYARI